ncbi:MAG: Ppx/GppA family phosphatase [Geminicoccaceae bacterium]
MPDSGAGRAKDGIGIVDIGSNSVRLVLFAGLRRTPIPLFNTKVTPRLGQGLGKTGKLNPSGVTLTLASLQRFGRQLDALGIERTKIFATAAVRDADDGEQFIQRARQILGRDIEILAGGEEARLSALGVITGYPYADGVMADLGGGSLELVELDGGTIGNRMSLPLGTLALSDLCEGDFARARKEIDRQLANEADWLRRVRGRALFPVGGSLRAIGRVHMAQREYHLRIIQGYGVPAEEVLSFCRRIAATDPAKLRLPGISRSRAELVPIAALVLERLVLLAEPSDVLFSAFGLREGAVYDLLAEHERLRDPLFEACARMAPVPSGREDIAAELLAFTTPLVGDERARDLRMRLAACRLANIGWQEHPHYRAEQAMLRVLRSTEITSRHDERAYLALAVKYRYGGNQRTPGASHVYDLLDDDMAQRAALVGLGLRLGCKLSASARSLLAESELRVEDGTVHLVLPPNLPTDDAIEVRLTDLARKAGLKVRH